MLHLAAATQVKYDNTAPWSAMSPWDILTDILQRTTDLETSSRTVIGAGNKFTALRYLTSGIGELSAAVDASEAEANDVGGNSSSRPSAANLQKYKEILSELYKEILMNSVSSNASTAVDDELQQAIVNSVDFDDVDIVKLLSKCAVIQKQLELNSVQGFRIVDPTSAIEKLLK